MSCRLARWLGRREPHTDLPRSIVERRSGEELLTRFGTLPPHKQYPAERASGSAAARVSGGRLVEPSGQHCQKAPEHSAAASQFSRRNYIIALRLELDDYAQTNREHSSRLVQARRHF